MRKLDHWLLAYSRFTNDQESPDIFHLWVGMSVISVALGRRVWIDKGHYRLYPNLYVILVAGSAMQRKSTALNIGVQFIDQLENKPNIIAQKVTPEALISAMRNVVKIEMGGKLVEHPRSIGFVVASELAVFMGRDSYNNGLIAFMTDAYDCPKKWEYETLKRGKEKLSDVWLGMLAASTPDWLKTAIPIEAVGGGFTSRVIFVYCVKNEKTPNAFPLVTKEQLELKELLVEDLRQIEHLEGEFTLTPEAHEWYSEWYNKFFYTRKDQDGGLSGYFGRKHDTLLKVGMLVSAAKRNTMVIEGDDLVRAEKVLTAMEEDMGNAVDSIEATPQGEQANRVLQFVRKFGASGVSYCAILRTFSWKVDAETMKGILYSLEQAERIVTKRTEPQRGKKLGALWVYAT